MDSYLQKEEAVNNDLALSAMVFILGAASLIRQKSFQALLRNI
jgi:hypothetical protein